MPIMFNDEGTDTSDRIAVRHDFEEVGYYLSDFAQKILYEVLTKIDSKISAKGQLICIRASELPDFADYPRSTVYRKFKSACEEVRRLEVVFRGEDDEWEYEGGIAIFAGALTRKKKNSNSKKPPLEAWFAISEAAAPYLTELKKDSLFTIMLSAQIRLLKASPSMRLYQWLRRHHWITKYKKETVQNITLDELRAKIDFSNKYPEWSDFKRRILDPSVTEVNTKSDVRCDYELIRSGRGGKVSGFHFRIRHADFFIPTDDPAARSMEAELMHRDLPQMDEAMRAIILQTIPDMPEGLITLLAMYPTNMLQETVMDYMRAQLKRRLDKPIDFFLGIIKNKAKELPADAPGRDFEEKIKDTSWSKKYSFNFDD